MYVAKVTYLLPFCPFGGVRVVDWCNSISLGETMKGDEVGKSRGEDPWGEYLKPSKGDVLPSVGSTNACKGLVQSL